MTFIFSSRSALTLVANGSGPSRSNSSVSTSMLISIIHVERTPVRSRSLSIGILFYFLGERSNFSVRAAGLAKRSGTLDGKDSSRARLTLPNPNRSLFREPLHHFDEVASRDWNHFAGYLRHRNFRRQVNCVRTSCDGFAASARRRDCRRQAERE